MINKMLQQCITITKSKQKVSKQAHIALIIVTTITTSHSRQTLSILIKVNVIFPYSVLHKHKNMDHRNGLKIYTYCLTPK